MTGVSKGQREVVRTGKGCRDGGPKGEEELEVGGGRECDRAEV